MTAVRLSSFALAACSKASHMEPSAISLSPQSAQTRYGRRSSRLPARATPTAMGRPWPSEPVATSTHGSTGVGWPSNGLPSLRKLSSSSSVIAPAALKSEYTSGEAWPLEKIRWSFAGLSGSEKSYRRYLSRRTAIRSAADIDDVG